MPVAPPWPIRAAAVAAAAVATAVAAPCGNTAVGCGVATVAGSDIVHTVTVSAGPTTLVLNASSGGVVSVRRGGVEFLVGSAAFAEPLFTLGLTRPSDLGGPLKVLSSDFRTIRVTQATPGGAVAVTFSDHPGAFGQPLDLNATASITPNASTGRVHFGLSIGRPPPRPPQQARWAVQTAVYPGLAQRADHVGAGDAVLHPCGEGAVLPGPFNTTHSFGSRAGFTATGGSSVMRCGAAQVAARVTDTEGIVIEAHDTTGSVKQWLFDSVPRQRLRLELQHFFTEETGAAVAVPYDTTVGTCGAGGWRAAADMYKSWSRHQPWAATPLTARTDLPEIVLTGAPGVIGGIQNASGYSAAGVLGPQLELLPSYLAAFKAKLNTSRMIYVPYGWENRGTWAGIKYFPAVPSNEAWGRVNRNLLASGDASMFLVSGSWWVLKREESSGGPAFDDSKELDDPHNVAMLVKTLHPQRDNSTVWVDDQYNLSVARQPWRGLSVELCHGHQGAQQTLEEIFNQVRALGVSIGSFDQDISGDQFMPCYDPSHPHGPGLGSYMQEGFVTMVAAINAKSKAAGQKFALSSEQTSEIAIPQMGTFWSRQFAPIDFPSGGFEGVGLFSYLYHEYVPAMAAAIVQGQGLGGTHPHPLLRVKAMSDALVRGLALVPFVQDVSLNGNEWNRVVSAAFHSYGGVPPRFTEHLVFGETLHPPAVDCANLSLWLIAGNKTRQFQRPITVPAVSVGSFRGRVRPTGADAGLGTVVANVANTTQDARVAVGPTVAGAASLVLFDALRNPIRAWPGGSVPEVVSLTLGPFEVVFLLANFTSP